MEVKNRVHFAIVVMLLFAAHQFTGCEQQRRPSRYLMPEGYVGRVRIEFKTKNAPPIPLEAGYYLFTIPANGLLQTSSDIEYGWAKDEYYYYDDHGRRQLPVTGWGHGGMIWGGGNGEDTDSRIGTRVLYEGFFVGTEAQYAEHREEAKSENNNK